MEAHVYILYSQSINKYYVGFTTEAVIIRLERHNTDYYENKYTAKGKPWILFLSIECNSIEQAKNIETHIKSMKSTTYITNLALYEEMVEKLKLKYR